MSPFAILSDCTCDLTPEQAEWLGIEILPVGVTVGKQSFLHYPDCRELPMKDFYSALRAGLKVGTSAVNPSMWLDAMEPVLKSGQDIIAVTLSATLTCGCANARMAASELLESYPDRRIYVLDSLCGSLGIGLLLEMASAWRAEGMSAAETFAHMETAKMHIVHLFTVDSLDHLRRGGRISPAAAVIGSMLAIKPVLSCDKEGRLFTFDKARGRKAAIRRLAGCVREYGFPDSGRRRLCIAHADCTDDAEALAQELLKICPGADITINPLSPVMASHAGPGALALFFVGRRPRHII